MVIFSVLSVLGFIAVTYIGIRAFRNGFRDLLRRDHETGPDPLVSREEEIQRLEAWNKSWSHPEVDSNTYYWDSYEEKYVEKSPEHKRIDEAREIVARGYPEPLLVTNVHTGTFCRCDEFSEGYRCSACVLAERNTARRYSGIGTDHLH